MLNQATTTPDGLPQQTRRLGTSTADLAEAGALLRAGALVAIPTETVYGLAAHALHAAAVEAIFAAKQRPHWDPLIVHVASTAMLEEVVADLSPVARRLAEAFWPGPLTLLLPRSPRVPDAVTAGRPLVAVRWPAHPVAQALIAEAGVPLAAPSANRFGHVSPTTADHVLADLHGRIEAVVDGGPTEIGLESTVIDPNGTPIVIYRQGGVSAAEIERVSGCLTAFYVPVGQQLPSSLPSPGVGIRHYAPRARVVLAEGEPGMRAAIGDGPNTGVLLPLGWPSSPAAVAVPWGQWESTSSLAHGLYAGLRELDERGVERIVVPLPESRPGDDLREALRDRLRKAAMPAS